MQGQKSLPGDALYKVDGTEVIGMDLSLLVNNYVKGEEGSQLTITVYRENSDEYKDITLTRRPIDVQTVSGKMLDEEIGEIMEMQIALDRYNQTFLFEADI